MLVSDPWGFFALHGGALASPAWGGTVSGQAELVGGWLRANEIKNDTIHDNVIALGEV